MCKYVIETQFSSPVPGKAVNMELFQNVNIPLLSCPVGRVASWFSLRFPQNSGYVAVLNGFTHVSLDWCSFLKLIAFSDYSSRLFIVLLDGMHLHIYI